VESITVPVALAAVGGIYVLWQGRDRSLATYLTSLALFHIAFLTLLSTRTAVSQFYLVPALPVFFIGAGVFLDRLFEIDWKVRRRWVLPAIITVLIMAAGAPTLASYYRNGRRFDFDGVAHWLEPRLRTGDAVFSDQPMVLAHYLPSTPVQKLRSLEPLAQSLDSLYRAPERAALWIVAPAPGHAFRPDLKQGGLARWMWENCQLRQTVGVGRIDFRQQYLQVYRCPAQPPEKQG
jgi:hypothetical protein